MFDCRQSKAASGKRNGLREHPEHGRKGGLRAMQAAET